MGHRREEDCPKVFNGSITLRKARARTCQHARNDWTCSTIWVYINWPLGPYQLNDDVRKRVTLKVWGSVFCYMASRAIHVELATTLSTENFLIAYQRLTGTWNWENIENPSSWFSTQEWCCRSCCVNSKEGIPDSWEGGLTQLQWVTSNSLHHSQPCKWAPNWCQSSELKGLHLVYHTQHSPTWSGIPKWGLENFQLFPNIHTKDSEQCSQRCPCSGGAGTNSPVPTYLSEANGILDRGMSPLAMLFGCVTKMH